MDKMQSFLIRPQLYEGESLGGYVERLIFKNNCTNISWFSRVSHIPTQIIHNNMFSVQDIHTITTLTQIKEEVLFPHTLTYWRERFPSPADKYFLKRNLKYCPLCLRENHIHKYIWDFQMVCICQKHQCILIDRCSKCQRNITMASFSKGYCSDCGSKYEESEFNLYKTDSLFYRAQIALQKACFEDELILKEDFGGISFKDFIKLSEASFHILNDLPSVCELNDKIRIFTKKGHRLSNYSYLDVYSNVFWMYEDFPNHFNIILMEWFEYRTKKMFYEQKNIFESSIEQFQIVKRAYIDFWLDAMDHGLIRRDFSLFKLDPSMLDERTMIRKEEIKALSGMSYKKIEHLASKGKLKMCLMPTKQGKKYLINRQSYNSLQAEACLYITRTETAKLLGIRNKALSDIIDSGIISEVESPINQNKRIVKDHVTSLIQTCLGTYRSNLCNLDNVLSFHKALNKYSVNGLSVVKLIEFIVHGKIKSYSMSRSGTLADTYYSIADLEKCVRILRNDRQVKDGFYMTEVLKILRIGERKMWVLIKSGKLIPDKEINLKDGRKRYMFRKETVESYKASIQSEIEEV